MEFNDKKSISQKINIHFFIVAIAVAIGFYVALADSGKYVSKLDILLLPKNEKTATQIDEVRGNLITIFKKTSSSDNVIVKEKKGTTLISIESNKNEESEATDSSREAFQEITNIASRYYSIKRDLDLRTVSEETQESGHNVVAIIFLSIILGLIVSFIIQLIVNIVESSVAGIRKNKKDVSEVSRDIESMLTKNKSKIEKLSYFPKKKENVADNEYPAEEIVENDPTGVVEETVIEEIPIWKEEATSVSNFKKASSPQNLPVESFENLVDDGAEDPDPVPNNLPFEISEEMNDKKEDQDLSQESSEEPTEEEYRERLNQLLKGE